ncbi:MAG TPA: TonB family protein [Gemmatimonadales bacterium]|nr:TonB family protein [Gemmatimonadales bacterium]
MFELLPASVSAPESATGHAAASFGIHALLIGSAVLLTRHATPAPTHRVPPVNVVYVPIAPPTPRPPRLPTVVGPLPITPRGIPLPLPSPLSIPAFPGDPATPNAPTLPGAGPATGQSQHAGAQPGPAGPAAWAATAVDEPVRVLRAGRLRYPVALERAGVSGEVVVEFIVDTTGSVEAGSARIVSSSAPEFEKAALDAIRSARYRAARLRAVPVRQLVRQRLGFVAGTR